MPYVPEQQLEWENRLIQEVMGYIQSLTRIVQPQQIVYVAVDGVAPMAKIKQQRARRFKSAVLAEQEAKVRAEAKGVPYEPVVRWDTNAITPGTEFMRRLAVALRALKLSVPCIVSPADEPGEGEQKIMEWLRSQTEYPEVVVYGLDADLIVLCLLESARSGRCMDLFREETEVTGKVSTNALGEEEYVYLQTGPLAKALYDAWGTYTTQQAFLNSFVGVMNLLGNDFVPHGMSLKIHDQGIESVLGLLNSKQVLLVNAKQEYDWDVLRMLFGEFAVQEPTKLLRGIRRKLGTRVGASASNEVDPEVRALAQMNDVPVTWAAERCLVEPKQEGGKTVWVLRSSWMEEYNREALWGSPVESVCEVYCKTLAWTLNYYMGRPIDRSWYYPWFLPPLFSSLVTYLAKQTPPSAPTSSDKPLSPVAQLAMVLPGSSFSLLPKELQRLPQLYPHAWPTAWTSFSLGRRFLWECEPQIPLIQPHQMRTWMEECMDQE